MNVLDLLEELKDRGIRLWLEDGELRYRASRGAFDAALQARVRAQREAIIAFLGRGQDGRAPRVSPRPPGETVLPLSYPQQRLWFLARFEDQAAAYHCPTVVGLPAGVEAGLLEQALNALVARHESLRTTFRLGEAGPQQIIHPRLTVTLPVHDLALSQSPLEQARERVEQVTLAPFDLEQGPLLRAALIRLPDASSHLVLCLHHIVTDGWSMGILQRELVELYTAAAAGRQPGLAPPAVQYGDFALWQRREVEGRVLTRELPYWRRQLAGAEAGLELPLDFPRPAQRSARGALYEGRLDRQLTADLKALAEARRVTPFMVSLAVFKMLLARLGGQDDLCVGTPVANRVRGELEGVIGFFVNTLVLRSRPGLELPFGDYLERLRETCLEAFDHQELPFELLVEKLDAGRDLARTPLFQVMFALQNAAGSALTARAGGGSPIRPRLDGAKFDLNVSLTEVDGCYTVECEYATALFREETVARLLDWYQRLLAAVVADPWRRLGEYDYLDERQRRQVLELGRGARRDYPLAPVHRLFEAQVAARPEAEALRFDGRTLSYGQLDRRANALAAELVRAGVQPGEIVPLCMERSMAMVVAILAILKAGGAYLPLDPKLPQQRMRFMLQDARARLVLVQPALAAPFAGGPVPVRGVEDDGAEQADGPRPVLPLTRPAYALYTSGSTGLPKGVINHHAALVNRLAWMQDNHPIGPGDRVLQKTNYAFDVSVWEFLWPLVQGATLVMALPGGHLDPAYLVRTIAAERITVLHFVPSMFQLFLAQAGVRDLTGLQAVFTSGEALPWECVERFQALGLPARLYNLYGPTEAAIDVTVWDCARPPWRERLVPIGAPIANLTVRVLDAWQQPVPVGVVGEICLGGAGLASGYLNRPQLTARSFIPDPHGEPGARLYRTGDLGRWLPDGSLEYLGRRDQQIKLRGQRLEIGEIEQQLMELPGVAQAAVVVARSPAGEDLLVAYLKADGPLPREEQLRQSLQRFLPDYMVPVRYLGVEELPLNANGKLDRKALAARPLAPPAGGADPRATAAPVSELEALIQEIWCRVLHLERVGPEQNFFELGGNSLTMVNVHHQLSQALERPLPLVKLFAHPTVRSLARYLENEDGDQPQQPSAGVAAIRSGQERLARLRQRRGRTTET